MLVFLIEKTIPVTTYTKDLYTSIYIKHMMEQIVFNCDYLSSENVIIYKTTRFSKRKKRNNILLLIWHIRFL